MGFLSGPPPVRYDCPGASKEWPIYGRSWLDASGVVYAALIFYNENNPQLECQVMESIRPMVGMR